MAGEERTRIAAVGEIEANANRAFDVDGVSVLLCNTKDGFFAVENVCSHQLTELEGGKIRGCFIFCPLHGQRFDLRDGKPIGQLTDKPIKTFPVTVENGEIFVRLAPQPAGAQD